MMGKISEFIHHHYRHFIAVALIDAADAYGRHLDQGGQMLVTLAGAMSTAELGLSHLVAHDSTCASRTIAS